MIIKTNIWVVLKCIDKCVEQFLFLSQTDFFFPHRHATLLFMRLSLSTGNNTDINDNR